MYLSAGERELVGKALNQDVKDDFFESEDFQDFLDLFKCRSRAFEAPVSNYDNYEKIENIEAVSRTDLFIYLTASGCYVG